MRIPDLEAHARIGEPPSGVVDVFGRRVDADHRGGARVCDDRAGQRAGPRPDVHPTPAAIGCHPRDEVVGDTPAPSTMKDS